MAGDRARAFAPATVANVGTAFDVLGFAVSQPGDVVELSLADYTGLRLTSITGDGGRLPTDVGKNTAAVAVAGLLTYLDRQVGLEIRLHKGLPLSSGLGGSAASAAAAVVAANRLLGAPLSVEELLPFVIRAEAAACGTAHADNAAPALLGGICLVRNLDPLDVVSLPVPEGLTCVLANPHHELRTEDARNVLPTHIELQKAVRQWGQVGGLTAALCLGDLGLLARCLDDELIEAVRMPLIPGFAAVKRAALAAGALGCSISGSGPTVFALCRGNDKAAAVGNAMVAAFSEAGLKSDMYISPIALSGARILDD